jgi:hypothetical protein
VAVYRRRGGWVVGVHGGADPVTGKQPQIQGSRKKVEKEEARQGQVIPAQNIGEMYEHICAPHTPSCKQKMCVDTITEQSYPVRQLLRPAVC